MKAPRPILLFMVTVAVAAMALGVSVSAAAPFPLRSPQVPFAYGALQGYFASIGEPSINVATMQYDAQSWAVTISGNAEFTILLKTMSPDNSIGIYTTTEVVPLLKQVFPGFAAAGWYATCHFTTVGTVKVSLFDDLGDLQGVTTYPIDRNNFGFYLQGPGGTFYSQDSRNGGAPQVLTYAGISNYGDWFECFEVAPYNPGSSTFTGCVLDLQSVIPTPTSQQSWGRLKSLYR